MAQHVTAEDSRYVIAVDGKDAGFAEYKDHDNGVREFDHTVIDPDFRGQGLSKPLIQFALDDTRNLGKTILPTCSAVQGFIEKNPEYADAVKEV